MSRNSREIFQEYVQDIKASKKVTVKVCPKIIRFPSMGMFLFFIEKVIFQEEAYLRLNNSIQNLRFNQLT